MSPPSLSKVTPSGKVIGARELQLMVEASLDGWLTTGRFAEQFEREFAKFVGIREAILVNSGSSANLVAVAALTSHLLGDRRLRPGDEVITVAAGFPTTVTPIVQLGLVPVFVDVSLPTYNLDPSRLEEARSERTRAVVVAHTLGNPFDLGAVQAFCQRHGLFLVEDNCDAAGSRYGGKKTGTFGDLATLSFYPPHHMTTGEGGAVLTSDDTLQRAVESLRDWGRDCWCASGVDNTCKRRFEWQLGDLPRGYDHKYVYSHLGFNLKMTDLQAAVGHAQLGRLDGFVRARRENWAFYREALADLDDALVLPEATEGAEPSWFGFLLTVREGAPFVRDDIVRHLEARKIQTRMLFAGNLVRQPAMTDLVREARAAGRPAPFRVAGGLERTDVVMNRTFWFGVYPGLTAPMREYVAETMRAFVRGRR